MSDKKKKTKEQKKQEKLEKEQRQQDLLQQQAELEELRTRVTALLLENQPPSDVEFVKQQFPEITKNPWLLVQDEIFAEGFLKKLKAVFISLGDEEQAESDELKDCMQVIHDELSELSDFVMGQPVYFFTSEKTILQLVEILSLLLQDEEHYSYFLAMLLPTVSNPNMSRVVANSGLIDSVLRFTRVHMTGNNTSPNAPQEHSNYSDKTFDIVMRIIEQFGANVELRQLVKTRTDNYLHLRGLAAGSTPGWSQQRQFVAQKSLRLFIRDSAVEKSLGKLIHLAPERNNRALLAYWRGHIHQLECDGVASGADSGLSRTRRSIISGFANQDSLDTLNNLVKKRSHKARNLV